MIPTPDRAALDALEAESFEDGVKPRVVADEIGEAPNRDVVCRKLAGLDGTAYGIEIRISIRITDGTKRVDPVRLQLTRLHRCDCGFDLS
jgi:hypothetical protein